MKHRVSLKKLNKMSAHRKAMIRNMLVALFREERIKTTLAKAKVLKRFAERLITRSRKDGMHNRRMARKWVQDKVVLNKLFVEIGPNYLQRCGGYTRIVKIGQRYGDASEMAYIALVADEIQLPAPKKTKKQAKVSNTHDNAKPKKADELTDETNSVDEVLKREESDEAADLVSEPAQRNDDTKEQKKNHEQLKYTSKSMHSTVNVQKTKVSNAVQQKAQRYRSDKGK